jgi:hypothetical protein
LRLINPRPYGEGLLNDTRWAGIRSSSKSIGLVDLDILIYQAGFAIEHNDVTLFSPEGYCLGEFKGKKEANDFIRENGLKDDGIEKEIVHWIEDFSHARLILDNMINTVHQSALCGGYRYFLTKGSTLWRNNAARMAKYKGNREKMEKPKAYDYLRNYAVGVYKAEIYEGLEADDVIAELARRDRFGSIVISIDKDLDQIPCLHMSSKEPRQPHFVSELVAARRLYAQALCGDTCDNIRGLHGSREKAGWSPAAAEKAMEQFTTETAMAAFVVAEYQSRLAEGFTAYDGQLLTWQECLLDTMNMLFLRGSEKQKFTLVEEN